MHAGRPSRRTPSAGPKLGAQGPDLYNARFAQAVSPLMNEHDQQVIQCIESLCECGCDAVRATISAMEASLPVAQTEGMDRQQQQQVLDELKAIMAVYDKP